MKVRFTVNSTPVLERVTEVDVVAETTNVSIVLIRMDKTLKFSIFFCLMVVVFKVGKFLFKIVKRVFTRIFVAFFSDLFSTLLFGSFGAEGYNIVMVIYEFKKSLSDYILDNFSKTYFLTSITKTNYKRKVT